MSKEYVSVSAAWPGTVELDKDGDQHIQRVGEYGYEDDAYITLTPTDKMALGQDLIYSAIIEIQEANK